MFRVYTGSGMLGGGGGSVCLCVWWGQCYVEVLCFCAVPWLWDELKVVQ